MQTIRTAPDSVKTKVAAAVTDDEKFEAATFWLGTWHVETRSPEARRLISEVAALRS